MSDGEIQESKRMRESKRMGIEVQRIRAGVIGMEVRCIFIGTD